MIVACVLRYGGDYGPEYVARLREGVRRYLSGARFVCLSDGEVPCERIPLTTRWPGWLSKLEIFRPGLFDGPVLYLDLDTAVTGSLAEIAAYPHRFTMLSDFYRPELAASGVMAWCGDYSAIFRRFSDRLVPLFRGIRPFRGDCGWILRCLDQEPERFQDLFPGQVVSYKADVRAPTGHRCDRGTGAVPCNARLVCFHGRPRPHELNWQLCPEDHRHG